MVIQLNDITAENDQSDIQRQSKIRYTDGKKLCIGFNDLVDKGIGCVKCLTNYINSNCFGIVPRQGPKSIIWIFRHFPLNFLVQSLYGYFGFNALRM